MKTVIVVTGAGSGMGRACIEPMRAMADIVIAADLRVPDLDGVVNVACDVTDAAQVDSLASRAGSLGVLRGLVHAAGVSPSMTDARRVFEVNLVGTHLVVNAFEAMVVSGTAAVCFASTAAHQYAMFVDERQAVYLDDPLAADFLDRVPEFAPDSGIAYGLSKFGVQMAVRRAAARWGLKGGRINSVSPGITDTPMGRLELEHHAVMRSMLEHMPLPRMGEPHEVAAAVEFLMSDAASFVTGTDLLVDGGLVSIGDVRLR